MSKVIHYRITAYRTVPIRSELTRLVRCTRQDSTATPGHGKWRIEILDFPMDGILNTIYVHRSKLRDIFLGRTICSKIICSLALGSKIEWSAHWELIPKSEAIKMLIEGEK